jgi:ELWxxDGT repeat protein
LLHTVNESATYFTEVNGQVFFVDGTSGQELWATDGTSAGTFLVKEIPPPGIVSRNLSQLTNVSGTLFFVADGTQLWESNGTAAGTSMVKDINPGAFTPGSGTKELTNLSGTLFFAASDGISASAHGQELWESNGTSAGTFMVKDINASGQQAYPGSYPHSLTNVNGTLFFSANDGVHGREVWRSDGTANGTGLVKDINPGSADALKKYANLVNVNGILFFTANDGTHGRELWRSDGTVGGTALVKDINPGSADSGVYTPLFNENGTLFFSANDGTHGQELWRSDGTDAGTFLVQDINPGPSDSYPGPFATANGTLFFSANDGTHGFELWESNGIAAGTFLVKDINPGPSNSSSQLFTNVNGSLFFTANDGVHGFELWTTDGTTAGTFLLNDIRPGAQGSYPYDLINRNGTLFFSADDGTSHGKEPWTLKHGSTTTVGSTFNPSFFGQTVVFSATVSSDTPGTGIPTGTVTFSIDGTPLASGPVTLTGGTATFSTTTLSVSSHTVTATYNGEDGRFAMSSGSDSASPQVVNKDATTTTVLAAPSPLVSGQSVVFFAIVTNASGPFGAPTGAVQFAVDGTNLGSPVTLVSGVAPSLTTRLTATGGRHTVTATYTNKDGNFINSGGMLSQAVGEAGTRTTLTSSPNVSVVGQLVVFTASVSVLTPGGGTPTGTVDFKEGGTDLTPGGVALAAGRATFTTSSLTLGHHTITATYGGDMNFTGSSGNDSAAPQVVNQASSRTVLTAFPDPAVFGQAVSFTVGVSVLSPGRGTPTGMVTFEDGTATIGSIMLNGVGRATFTTAALSRGNHAISANYGGDGNFLPSAYVNFGEPIQKDATSTTVIASANPVMAGHVVTFTATVQASAPGSGSPTGSVTFKDIITVLGTGTLNGSGQATFSTSALAVGIHAITATYGGDNNFAGDVSAILAEAVNANSRTAPTITPASASTVGRVSNLAALGHTAPPTTSAAPASGGTGAALGGADASVPPVAVSPAAGLAPATVDRYFAAREERGRHRASLLARPKHPGVDADWL